MSNAGREPLHADFERMSEVETIANNYLRESGGDPGKALRHIIADALADLLEWERRSHRAERLLSRGYVRSRFEPGR